MKWVTFFVKKNLISCEQKEVMGSLLKLDTFLVNIVLQERLKSKMLFNETYCSNFVFFEKNIFRKIYLVFDLIILLWTLKILYLCRKTFTYISTTPIKPSCLSILAANMSLSKDHWLWTEESFEKFQNTIFFKIL